MRRRWSMPCVALALAAIPAPAQVPLGTAFTYQGRLVANGSPATGSHDFEFRLFDAATARNAVGILVSLGNVPVTSGLFTVTLDFGSSPHPFGAEARWLEIRVRPTGGGSYTTLLPRQELTGVPNALWASKAGDALALGGIASSGYLLSSAVIPISQGGTGATNAADALLALNAQARHAAGCPTGASVRSVNADGTVVCGVDADTNSGGTVTSVATGAGLKGGPINTMGTIAVATGGITSTMLADGAVTSGKIAGGAVGAAQIDPSQVQLRVSAVCPVGRFLRGVNADGSALCEPLSLTTTITTVDDPVNQVGEYNSIAIGTDGFPVISYYDHTAGALKVAKCVDAACSGPSTITTV